MSGRIPALRCPPRCADPPFPFPFLSLPSDWCFLQLCPADYEFPEGTSAAGKKKVHRRMAISQDGIHISTKLLKPKRVLLSTMHAYGKPLTMTILPSTIPKLVTLLACSPKVNGNGVIVT